VAPGEYRNGRKACQTGHLRCSVGLCTKSARTASGDCYLLVINENWGVGGARILAPEDSPDNALRFTIQSVIASGHLNVEESGVGKIPTAAAASPTGISITGKRAAFEIL
jgi:hypothetical protein